MKPMQSEIWKPILGYSGMYEVSNHGRIRSWKPINRNAQKPSIARILTLVSVSDGYKHVFLSKNGEKGWLYVHRAVANAFISNPENKPCINHIDGNPSNNHVSNLEWCTVAENAQHENAGNSKLTVDDVREIRGMYENESISQYTLADQFGVSPTHIGRIVNRKRWANIN